MENDPSKKESKGKRIFKKAIRRNSKSNNSSQNSALEQGIGVSRSKSFENKRVSIEINDSAPLPTPDGTKEKVEAAQKIKLEDKTQNQDRSKDAGQKKNIIGLQDARNQNKETPSGSNKGVKISSPKLEIKDERPSEPAISLKKNLKRVGVLNHLLTMKLRGDHSVFLDFYQGFIFYQGVLNYSAFYWSAVCSRTLIQYRGKLKKRFDVLPSHLVLWY